MHRYSFLALLLMPVLTFAQDKQPPTIPSFDYDAALQHELKPHRRTIPTNGVSSGFHQLRLALTVSPTGEVAKAEASGEDKDLEHWRELETEVRGWKFIPFEVAGKPMTAEVEEYLDLVPPERFPRKHLPGPAISPNSKVTIVLQRSGCFGNCPAYSVKVSTGGIDYEGYSDVVASGHHVDTIQPSKVRELARQFVADDFYSMNEVYRAAVTDNPTYGLSITIDGREKQVEDYVGSWVGMPAVITELENKVDEFAQARRWIEGEKGLVQALSAEDFNFKTFEAQILLKEAALRGKVSTVRELLQAGVPLEPIAPPKPSEPYMGVPFEYEGWLTVAAAHAEALKVLIDGNASKHDQGDKDLGLVGAARAGNLEGVQALIVYGADPNANLSDATLTERSGGMIITIKGAGSSLIAAAESGNPEIIREILKYRPNLEARDHPGRTAMFAASEYRYNDPDGARAKCVRLLAEAGADVNARDGDGNTPLHETFLTEVEEELLRLGADVNAGNKNGETPIFTTVDLTAFSLFIAHGADLSIRNNKGETVIEAAKEKGHAHETALQQAIWRANHQ